MLAISRVVIVSLAVAIGSLSNARASEPGQDQELKGPPELEQRRAQNSQSEQVVTDNSGGDFMEEVSDHKAPAKKPPRPIKIDLENVGVSVDGNGKIIPLLNRGGPAVVQSSTQFEQSVQTIAPNLYGYGFNPYRFNSYGLNPYGLRPYGPPGFRPFGPVMQRNISIQQSTVYFGTGQPWFAPPMPPPAAQSPSLAPSDPFF
ncbi:unnamed protein product [Sphagnum balticum]